MILFCTWICASPDVNWCFHGNWWDMVTPSDSCQVFILYNPYLVHMCYIWNIWSFSEEEFVCCQLNNKLMNLPLNDTSRTELIIFTVDLLKPDLHVTFFTMFFKLFKMGWMNSCAVNSCEWCCSHMILKYVKKIKCSADKNSAKTVCVNVPKAFVNI